MRYPKSKYKYMIRENKNRKQTSLRSHQSTNCQSVNEYTIENMAIYFILCFMIYIQNR